MAKSHTLEKFIEKSIKIYGDKYDYSKVNYIDSNTKVEIVCPIHGSFHKSPKNFLDGFGCNLCAKDERSSLNKLKNKFIKKAIEKFGDKYNYSKVDYVNAFVNITVICDIHGEFITQPANFLFGRGCTLCNKENKTSFELRQKQISFIEKAKAIHGDRYNYDKSIFVRSDKPLIITCYKHGDFKMSPQRHIMNGCNCIQCNIENSRFTRDEFIDRGRAVHGDKYDYSKVDYYNSETKVIIICPTHGEFSQTPSLHLSKRGCPRCKDSRGEKLITKYLKNNNIEYIHQASFDNCRSPNSNHKLKFDFYLKALNVLIEFDGKQHFESVKIWGGEENLKEIQFRDNIKNQYAIENNIKLIRISYKDINNVDTILEKELNNG